MIFLCDVCTRFEILHILDHISIIHTDELKKNVQSKILHKSEFLQKLKGKIVSLK